MVTLGGKCSDDSASAAFMQQHRQQVDEQKKNRQQQQEKQSKIVLDLLGYDDARRKWNWLVEYYKGYDVLHRVICVAFAARLEGLANSKILRSEPQNESEAIVDIIEKAEEHLRKAIEIERETSQH
jgi:hypothetical protein